MKRSELWSLLGAPPPPGPDPDVLAVTRDSREVGPAVVFVAVRGRHVDGHALAGSLSCAGLVVEALVDAVAPQVVVADSRKALALLAAALHGWPGRALPVVGVTGTNGKTTVTSLLAQAGSAFGRPWGRIGTLGAALGPEVRPGRFTTPEAPELQATLRWMVDRGAAGVAMEVSSIGLHYRRVDGIPFHVAVFTNLTRDHLDVHGDMVAYGAAKARLFAELLRAPGGFPRALLWNDDPAWATMGAPSDRWTYGGGRADLAFTVTDAGADGMALHVQTPLGPASIRSALVGTHNAQNLVAALGVLLLTGHDVEASAAAVGAARGAEGRLQRIADPRGRLVLVDYAHTDDALAAVLGAVRPWTRGRLWVVFGCGGDRDQGKRPRMGAVAERLADVVVVTSDNPRSEDPHDIMGQVLGGMERPQVARAIADRGEAIDLALHEAAPGDTVVVAGKGHEQTQEVGGSHYPFDDVARCAAAIAADRRLGLASPISSA